MSGSVSGSQRASARVSFAGREPKLATALAAQTAQPAGGRTRRSVLVEPLELVAAEQEDAAEDERGAALGVRLRVRERQRRAPGSQLSVP